MWTWWISEGNGEKEEWNAVLESLLRGSAVSSAWSLCVINNLYASINKPFLSRGRLQCLCLLLQGSGRFDGFHGSWSFSREDGRWRIVYVYSVFYRITEKRKRRDQHQLSSKNPIKSAWRTKWLMRCFLLCPSISSFDHNA